MNTALIQQWAEHTATDKEMESGFSTLLLHFVPLSPTVDVAEAQAAYQNYMNVCHNGATVKVVMVPCLLTIQPGL